MNPQTDLHEIDNRIQQIKEAVKELDQLGKELPAISKNTVRILASIKMLELNISDIIDV